MTTVIELNDSILEIGYSRRRPLNGPLADIHMGIPTPHTYQLPNDIPPHIDAMIRNTLYDRLPSIANVWRHVFLERRKSFTLKKM